MKKIFTFFLFLLGTNTFAQVGINTTTPKASLDVEAKKVNGVLDASTAHGIIAPRLTRAELESTSTKYTSEQEGTLVYIKNITGGTQTGKLINVDAIGYYYFDGSVWKKINTGTADSDKSIYTNNGVIANDRTVNLENKKLSFTSSATTGTGHFNVNDTTFSINTVKSMIGIGTNAPRQALEVNGKAHFNKEVVFNPFAYNYLDSRSYVKKVIEELNTFQVKFFDNFYVHGGTTRENVKKYGATFNVGTDNIDWGNALSNRGIQFVSTSAGGVSTRNPFVASLTAGAVSTNASGNDNRYLNFNVRTDSTHEDAVMTLRSYSATEKRVGIGTFNPNNRLEINEGTDGKSGLRFTTLKEAALLGTDTNGDVVKVDPATIINSTTKKEVLNLNPNETSKNLTLYSGLSTVIVNFRDNCNQKVSIRLFVTNEGSNWGFGYSDGAIATSSATNTTLTYQKNSNKEIKVTATGMSCANSGFNGSVQFTITVNNGTIVIKNG